MDEGHPCAEVAGVARAVVIPAIEQQPVLARGPHPPIISVILVVPVPVVFIPALHVDPVVAGNPPVLTRHPTGDTVYASGYQALLQPTHMGEPVLTAGPAAVRIRGLWVEYGH